MNQEKRIFTKNHLINKGLEIDFDNEKPRKCEAFHILFIFDTILERFSNFQSPTLFVLRFEDFLNRIAYAPIRIDRQ